MGLELSFSGCAWNTVFQIGVLRYLQSRLQAGHCTALGASAGAFVAACLVGDVPWEALKERVYLAARQSRRYRSGPVARVGGWQEEMLRDFLSQEPGFHRRVSGRLLVSVTRLPSLDNVFVSEFANNEELVRALMGSSHIPVYSGRPVLYARSLFVDGGITENHPRLSDRTVLVSPTRADAHVSPPQVYPFRSGFVPDPVVVLDRKLEEGYERAALFFEPLFRSDGRKILSAYLDEADDPEAWLDRYLLGAPADSNAESSSAS